MRERKTHISLSSLLFRHNSELAALRFPSVDKDHSTMPANKVSPDIVLYTSKKNRPESYPLIEFLSKSGHRFTVIDGAEKELQRRFGKTSLPGMCVRACCENLLICMVLSIRP